MLAVGLRECPLVQRGLPLASVVILIVHLGVHPVLVLPMPSFVAL